jgi:hypothetical protein
VEAMAGIARAFYWGSVLFLALVGFALAFLYHFTPLLPLLGVAMILLGWWKVRPLGFEGTVLLGFMMVVPALVFAPVVIALFVELFAGN